LTKIGNQQINDSDVFSFCWNNSWIGIVETWNFKVL